MARKNDRMSHAMCISNRGYRASLMSRRVYLVLPDPEAATRGLLRVVDESGEDYLYPAKLFVAVELPRQAGKAFRAAS